MDVADDHFRGLVDLLNQFRNPATPYPPRPFPKFAKRYNAYDHLARVKEWSRGDEAEEGGDVMASYDIPQETLGRQHKASNPRPVRLGFRQCRFGQDPCAREPGDPASPARRCALETPLPDLHQGRRREYGFGRLR